MGRAAVQKHTDDRDRSNDVSPILTVRQKPFAVQSSRERSFDTQAIEIISPQDLLRTYPILIPQLCHEDTAMQSKDHW